MTTKPTSTEILSAIQSGTPIYEILGDGPDGKAIPSGLGCLYFDRAEAEMHMAESAASAPEYRQWIIEMTTDGMQKALAVLQREEAAMLPETSWVARS